jgi:pilus assembly protein CpaF
MSGLELPMVAVRAQVASAVNLIVTCERMSDGTRKVTYVSEVLPLNERGDYRVQDIFVYTAMGKDSSGKVQGYHAPTGVVPNCLHKLRAAGFSGLDESFFDPATYRLPQPALFRTDAGAETKWAPSIRNGVPGDRPTFTFNPEASTINTTEAEVPQAEPTPTILVSPAPSVLEQTPTPVQRPVQRADQPTIQVSADLLNEMEAVLSQEFTRVGRAPSPEEKTDPHIRLS